MKEEQKKDILLKWVHHVIRGQYGGIPSKNILFICYRKKINLHHNVSKINLIYFIISCY